MSAYHYAVTNENWMEVVLASAPLVFGLGTALLYGDGPQTDRRD